MSDLSTAAPRQQQFEQLTHDGGRPARDVAPGERWAFIEHRSMAEIIAEEGQP
jgi:hypothetical protein